MYSIGIQIPIQNIIFKTYSNTHSKYFNINLFEYKIKVLFTRLHKTCNILF